LKISERMRDEDFLHRDGSTEKRSHWEMPSWSEAARLTGRSTKIELEVL
jgi:hypothetical protein